MDALRAGALPSLHLLIVMHMMLDVTTRRFLLALQRAEADAIAAGAATGEAGGGGGGVAWSLREVWVARSIFKPELQPILAALRLTKIVFK